MLLKGIDSIEFGLEIDCYASEMHSFLEKFKKHKEDAQNNKFEQKINLGGIEFIIHPTGQKFYSYRLTCKDFMIAFADTELPNNSPVHVRLLSSFIWSFGLKEAVNSFMNWFKSFSVTVSDNKLSRVDTCLDTDEIRFLQSDANDIVARARCKTEHFVNEEYTEGRVFSGLTIGRGDPLLARIYNKTLEIKKSGKTWFKDIWIENGWIENKDVWRVEFQLRRAVLKELGIFNIDNFLNKQNELWSYLTENWLSLRTINNQNVSRSKVKRKWRIVQKADFDYQPNPLIRNKIKLGNLQCLLDQAAGLMMSVASLSDHNSIEETSNLLKSWFEIKMSSKNVTFDEEKMRRQNQFLNILREVKGAKN